MLKWFGERGIDWIWQICEEADRISKIPEECENDLILPIYRKRREIKLR